MNNETTKEITLSTKEGDFKIYIAKPKGAATGVEADSDQKYPGLILIHEIWGLDDHIKDVTERYAEQGFVVLAPDLFSNTGILEKMSPTFHKELFDKENPEKQHQAQAKLREILQPIRTEEFAGSTLEKLNVCFSYLEKEESCTGNVGALGFCFGGTYSWKLATVEPKLRACVPFYGQPPQPFDDVESIACPILALYGEKDEGLIQTLPQLEEALKRYGKNYMVKVYKDAGHAFFNDRNPRAFNKEARDDSWSLSLDFLKRNLS